MLVVCGDLTDHGLPEEAALLAEDLAGLNMPIVSVLGNHDYHSDQPDDVKRILRETGVRVLDGEACEILGLGFAGIKGFAGGFGSASWSRGASGSSRASFKRQDEAQKLDAALAPASHCQEGGRAALRRNSRPPCWANRAKSCRSWDRVGWGGAAQSQRGPPGAARPRSSRQSRGKTRPAFRCSTFR